MVVTGPTRWQEEISDGAQSEEGVAAVVALIRRQVLAERLQDI